MGTNYIQRLRDQGRYDPAKWRREREAKQLENLQRAWIEANEVMQAEFMAWAGLTDATEEPLAADEVTALEQQITAELQAMVGPELAPGTSD